MSPRDKGRDTTLTKHVHLLIFGLLTDSPSATPRSLTSDHIRSDSVARSSLPGRAAAFPGGHTGARQMRMDHAWADLDPCEILVVKIARN